MYLEGDRKREEEKIEKKKRKRKANVSSSSDDADRTKRFFSFSLVHPVLLDVAEKCLRQAWSIALTRVRDSFSLCFRYASCLSRMNTPTPSSFADLVNITFNSSTFVPVPSTRESTPIISLWVRILTLTCMVLIDVCAFLGNLLVICAFFRTRRLQTVTNYFIASLAFADALVAVFVLPLGIYYYQRNRSWKLGLILCDLWVSSDVLLCTSSILNLTCISVDRYMAITRPLTYTAYRSKFLARVMILLVWIVSVIITCPPILGWRDSNRRQTVSVKGIELLLRVDLYRPESSLENSRTKRRTSCRSLLHYLTLQWYSLPRWIIHTIRPAREKPLWFVIFLHLSSFLQVEGEHKCDLNTARGYVVYSALGSFYIPAVVMIFVYIRIFMVVYDRENLIQKFHEKNYQSPGQVHQNGLTHKRTLSDGTNIAGADLRKGRSKSCCTCPCFPRYSRRNTALIAHPSTSFQNHCSLLESKPTETRCINQNRNRAHSKVSRLPKKSASTIFCRPCTLSSRKPANLSEEISHYRRHCLSSIGAEYQFRTGDSPCYEKKTFVNSLPPLQKGRSHSLEQLPTIPVSDGEIVRDQHRPVPVISLDQLTPTQDELTCSAHVSRSSNQPFRPFIHRERMPSTCLCLRRMRILFQFFDFSVVLRQILIESETQSTDNRLKRRTNCSLNQLLKGKIQSTELQPVQFDFKAWLTERKKLAIYLCTTSIECCRFGFVLFFDLRG